MGFAAVLPSRAGTQDEYSRLDLIEMQSDTCDMDSSWRLARSVLLWKLELEFGHEVSAADTVVRGRGVGWL